MGDDSLKERLDELLTLRENSRIEFHGLNLDREKMAGIGIILKTETQARKVIKDILWLIDCGKISKDLFSFILYFDQLVENMESLIDTNYVRSIIEKGLIQINKYFKVSSPLKREVKEKIDAICRRFKGYNNFSKTYQGGLPGISFPCLHSNEGKIARVLVEVRYIKCTSLGRYLIDLPILQPTSCMENNEEFVRQILNPIIEKELDISLTYYSIGSFSPKGTVTINDVRFYTEPNDDEWNNAHDENDY